MKQIKQAKGSQIQNAKVNFIKGIKKVKRKMKLVDR